MFSERRRNDLEEEPEWFSGGPTSQSETIELIGFDDKILEEDKRRPKRSRKRTDSVREGMSCWVLHTFRSSPKMIPLALQCYGCHVLFVLFSWVWFRLDISRQNMDLS